MYKKDTPMRRIPLILATLLLTMVPGCGSAQRFRPGVSDFPVSFTLEEGQSVAVHNLDETVELHAGNEVTFNWAESDPVLRLNGVQIRPAVPEPETFPTHQELMSYLDVTFPRYLVGEDLSYDTMLRAYQLFSAEKAALDLRLRREFAQRVPTWPTSPAGEQLASEAAAACETMARQNTLVETAEAEVGGVKLKLKGAAVRMLVELLPGDAWQEPVPAGTEISHEHALQHVQNIIVVLRRWNPVEVELGRGRFEVTYRTSR
jgi:hypothetical protein